MEEMENPTEETLEEEFDFAIEGEEQEEQTEETVPEQQNQENNQEETVVLNGKTYTTKEIEEKLTPSDEMQRIERIAREAGMSVAQYAQSIEDGMTKSKIDGRAQQLMEQGVEEEIALHLANVEHENAQLKREESFDAKAQKEIEAFAKKYPDVKELPDEVLADISQNGVTPVVAYQNHLIETLTKENKKLVKEKENKDTVIGSVKGAQAHKKDVFVEELFRE